MKRIIPLLLIAALAGCSKHGSSSASSASLPAAKVSTTVVRLEQAPAVIEVTGTVRPVQRATISAKVMGAIEEMPITLGQPVKAGDLLVKIAAGEISARVLQAQSQLNQARRDLERERGLVEKGASTPETVKALTDRLAMTEALVREAEVMLGYTSIRAPFDGVVARKLTDIGNLASPGMPLLAIEGSGDFEIETGIPESLAQNLKLGASFPVEVPASNASFSGSLTELSSAADPLARTVPAKISVPASTSVRSGQFARVQVAGAPVNRLLVPVAAVTSFGQMERVFVSRDNRAELRLVKTGARLGDRIEILSGLSDGDSVITAPPTGLTEGQPVTTN